LRKRIVGLLLLPILSLIFIIGWFMYFVGDKNENNRKAQKETDQTFVKSKKREIAEFGLVEELAEENKV
jgi:Tfp pilus assembly protein PilO